MEWINEFDVFWEEELDITHTNTYETFLFQLSVLKAKQSSKKNGLQTYVWYVNIIGFTRF